jgi:hypothetical protein
MNPDNVIVHVYRTTGPESELPHDQVEVVVKVIHQPTGLSAQRICGYGAVKECEQSLVDDLAALVATGIGRADDERQSR